MNKIIDEIRNKFSESGTEENLISIRKFFKESIQSYGIRNGEVEKIAKQYFSEIKLMPKSEVFQLCEELWKSNYIEEGFVACHFAEQKWKEFEENDIEIFERWISLYVTNWATCDTFCNHTVGDLLMKFPHLSEKTLLWTASQNRWLKRAAAVSYIVPAKKGLFLDTVFTIASKLLTDTDDMVQKGYGWMLKAASQAHEKEVFNFVVANKHTMPRTALRYAIEKMPNELRIIAMKK